MYHILVSFKHMLLRKLTNRCYKGITSLCTISEQLTYLTFRKNFCLYKRKVGDRLVDMEGKNEVKVVNSEKNPQKRPAEPYAWTKRKNNRVEQVVDEDFVRRKRRKFALLLSYSGKGYLGMQRNPGFRTIEDDLLQAMNKADLMNEEGCTCPQIYHFQRAARTDKGVSAARQVVSVKLPDDVANIPAAINQHLSESIQVMKAIRTTKGFNCKTWCDSRTYSYLCPTYAFTPVDKITTADYRITSEVVEELRKILASYKGTHNFHNFTARKKAHEDSAKRYIMDMTCGEPFERNGYEWIMITVKGQSFMLHQIRKMIGVAMAISRGIAGKDVIVKAFNNERFDLPIAPGLGLVLEEPHYEIYNKRFASDGIHEGLTWSDVTNEIQKFREKYIDFTIIDTEIRENPMIKWLETLPMHSFTVRDEKRIGYGATGIAGAAVKLAKHIRESVSDNEAEDEDEGDLDQYRVAHKLQNIVSQNGNETATTEEYLDQYAEEPQKESQTGNETTCTENK
ncbi:unnamed protein product, partial [Meganyctiphanes norvegica]